jgi:peptidoglycan/LPS O-acetylase OafA/YrhL
MQNPPPPIALPERLYSLDILRGIGALTIVINHWSNFFFYQPAGGALPLAFLLKPLYSNGWRAVDLFFCLSGFVFFWLYSDKIGRRQVGGWSFSVLRFTRLYPLHLLTLLFTAAVHLVMAHVFGKYFICAESTPGQFLLQIFLASGWFDNTVVWFNGPVWSVSVEIALYIGFFFLCRFRAVSWWLLLLYVGIGFYWTIHHWLFLGLARGVLSFFAGGLAFRAFEALLKNGRGFAHLKWLTIVTVCLWILVPLEVEKQFIATGVQKFFANTSLGFFEGVGKYLMRVTQAGYELVLFPVTLCLLALWETRRGTLGRRAAILGDISYSTYLLHFPLQMIFLLMAFWFGIPGTAFSSPLALLLFFLVLIPISVWSHNHFERPLQSFLRKKLLPDNRRRG